MFGRPISDAEDARRRARRVLPRVMFEYINGAAGEELGEAENRAALRRIRLKPRIMQDVRVRDLSTEVLGQACGLPFGIAPMGMCNLSWPGADEMLARLAAREGVPHGVSTVASTGLERLYDESQGLAWFQLYYSGDGSSTLKLVDRAAEAGYQTLILTVDVPEVGRRPKEKQHGFSIPFKQTPQTLVDFALHPRWSLTSLIKGAPSLGNFGVEDEKRGYVFDRAASRGGADWEWFDVLRQKWRGNLVVKGILDPRDAVEMKERGADAIQVSSHGGRQLDSAPLPVEALPLIREAVGKGYPVFFDSGVRNGEDVLKLLALGADYVFLGRPLQFSIAARQEAGLAEYWEGVKQELSLSMAMCGLTAIDQVKSKILA